METSMQRTLVLACWPVADPLLDGLDCEPALLEIAGKSTLQRSVEQAVMLGARRVDVVLGEHAAPYEACLDNGERWGCEIVYHYSRAGERPLRALARQLAGDAEYLVLHADRNLPPGHVPASGEIGCWIDAGEIRWCGWGRLAGSVLAQCLADAASREDLERALLAHPRVRRESVLAPTSADSAAGVLAAMQRLLHDPDFPVGIARQPSAAGLWLGNGSRVHPSAVVTAPAYLGDHVLVGAGAVIGPNAVIGSRSIVDREATIVDALVAPASYVGAGVEVRQSILTGQRLVNIALGVAVEIPDRELAGPAAASEGCIGPGVAERLLAAGLWTAALPLRGVGRSTHATQTTESAVEAVFRGDPGAWWRHFREVFHPGLGDVVRGRSRIVGPAGRSPAQIAALSGTGQKPHRESLPGLINEALLLGSDGADPAIRFAGDALAAKKLQMRHIVGAALRYARALVADRRSWRTAAARRAPQGSLAATTAGASGEGA
jgi:hypothetical protein